MANGTYGDSAFNPLVGYTDGLRKNYDNKNWVFYDPRRSKLSWIFNYLGLEKTYFTAEDALSLILNLQEGFYFVGTFSNGMETGTYLAHADFGEVQQRDIQTATDETGRYMYVAEAAPNSRLDAYSFGQAAKPFDKISFEIPFEMFTFTIPAQPPWSDPSDPGDEGAPPQAPYYNYNASHDYLVTLTLCQPGETEGSFDEIINFELEIGHSAFKYKYLDEDGNSFITPDEYFTTIQSFVYTDLGEAEPGEYYDDDSSTNLNLTDGTFTLMYDGTTGEVAGYLNGQKRISHYTDKTIGKDNYFVKTYYRSTFTETFDSINLPGRGLFKLGTATFAFE